MQYTIKEVTNGNALIEFSDGSETWVELNADMTEEDLDDLIFCIAPVTLKNGAAPSFVTAGAKRTAARKVFEEVAGSPEAGSP